MDHLNYQEHVPGFIEQQFLTCRPKNGLEFTISDTVNNDITFDLHRSGEGEFIDPKRSYFIFEFHLKKASGVSANYGLRLERSAGSIIQSYKIQSGFGVDLENVRDYSDGVEAMLTILEDHGSGGSIYGNGYKDVFYNANTSVDLIPRDMKDLGALIGSNYGSGLIANNLDSLNNLGAYSPVKTKYIHQLRSSVFGCFSNKYLPLSLMRGLRITLTLEWLSRCTTTVWAMTNDTTWTLTVLPVLKYYLIKLPSQIERRIFERSKIPIPGVGMQTMYLDTQLALSQRTWEWNLPIKCKSLRAVFIGFKTQSSYVGYDNGGVSGTNYAPAPEFMYSAFTHGYLTQYQFFLDEKPVTDQPINVYLCPRADALAQIKLALGIDLSDSTNYSRLFKKPMTTEYYTQDHINRPWYRNSLYGQMFPGTDMSTHPRSLNIKVESYLDWQKPVLIMWVYDQTLWIDTESGECVVDR